MFPRSKRSSREIIQQRCSFFVKREWKKHALDVVWWYAVRASKGVEFFKAFDVLHWNLCRETIEHLPLHQSDQSRLDLEVLPLAGWKGNGRAGSREVTRKVSLPDWNSLLLLLRHEFSGLLSSMLLRLHGLLHLLHSSNEFLMIAIVAHCGVSWPWLLTVYSF